MLGRTWERSSIKWPVVTAEQLLVVEEVEGQRRDCLDFGGVKTVSIDLSLDDAGDEWQGGDMTTSA